MEGVIYVGDNIGSGLTVEGLVLRTSEYLNDIEYSVGNRFIANEIDAYGISAIALNSISDTVNINAYSSDVVHELLTLPTNYSSGGPIGLSGALSRLEKEGFGCGTAFRDARAILLATSVGLALNEYWAEQIALTSPPSVWSTYFTGPFQSSWVSEGVRGALMFSEESDTMGIVSAAIIFSIFNLIEPSL